MPRVPHLNIVHNNTKTVTNIIISLALIVQIVPLIRKMILVAQVVVASCATCVTAQTSLVPDTHMALTWLFRSKH